MAAPVTLGALADAHALVLAPGAPGASGTGAASGTTWRDLPVSGVRQDNRQIRGGELFVAVPGLHVHAARFAAAAAAAGAVAVLTDAEGATLAAGVPVPVLTPADGRPETLIALLGALAADICGHPARRLTGFAVTGTNGKTTVAYMVDHILTSLGRTTGLVGTVEVRIAGRGEPAVLTTPQAVDLQTMLATMVDAGVTDLTMEVSSHALALGRVDTVRYAVAGFTNLTQDHLDFHPTFEDYFAAKAALFDAARTGRAVVLLDDAWGRRLHREIAERRGPGEAVPLAVFPDDPDAARPARTDGWWVESVREVAARTAGTGGTSDAPRQGPAEPRARSEFTVRHADGRVLHTETDLPGAFNVANAALAAVMVIESGVPVARVQAALDAHGGVSPRVPGRMEVLAEQPRVIVDFAHNPGALAAALETLRPSTSGRLVVLFGAAGERDRAKRPDMGRLAVLGADEVIVTDDDPHDEPADQIRAEVLAGTVEVPDARADVVREIVPREAAILCAVLQARDEDTVLVAGRGHETVQDLAGVAHPLDDRVEVRSALARRAQEKSR